MHSTPANIVCLVHTVPELLEFLCCLLMAKEYGYLFVQSSGTGLMCVLYFNVSNLPTSRKLAVGKKCEMMMLLPVYCHCFPQG